jgi:hypothetical protein
MMFYCKQSNFDNNWYLLIILEFWQYKDQFIQLAASPYDLAIIRMQRER